MNAFRWLVFPVGAPLRAGATARQSLLGGALALLLILTIGVRPAAAQRYWLKYLDTSQLSAQLASYGFRDKTVNASGLKVGSEGDPSVPNVWHVILNAGGTTLNLGTLEGVSSMGSAINDAGQIVGSQAVQGNYRMGFLLTPEDTDGDGKPDLWFKPDPAHPTGNLLMQGIGTLRGGFSAPDSINAQGHIVGWSDFEAFFFDGHTMLDLGTLHGASGSCAYVINDVDQIVGISGSERGPTVGFLWENGVLQDLNDLIPTGSGWTVWQANTINNAGLIACVAVRTGTTPERDGDFVNFLLTPYTVALPPPPAVPSNLVVNSPTQTGFTLTWKDNEPVSNLPKDSTAETGFAIERSKAGGPFSRIASVGVDTTSFADTSLQPDTLYSYRVRSLNAGSASDPSNVVSAGTLPINPTLTFSPDTIPGGASTTGTITLDLPAPDGGATVSLSNPNKAILSVPQSVAIPAGKTSTSFSIATRPVSELTALEISIRYGSVTKSATLTVLPPVVVASVTLLPDSVTGGRSSTGTVSLSNPAPAGGGVVALASGNPELATVPATVLLAPGTTSTTFRVSSRAVDADVNVAISASYLGTKRAATLQIVPATEAPAGPTNLEVGSATPTSLTLEWLDNSATATGFEIERRTADTSFAHLWELGADATTFTDTGLAPGTTYIYRVRAVNSAGASAYSNEASGATLPAGLAFLTLAPDTLTGGDTATATVTLSGPAPPGGAVISVSSSYPNLGQVSRSVLIPEGATWGSFNLITSVVGSSTSVTISATYAGATQTATLTVLPSTTLGSAILAPLRAQGTRHIAVMRPSTHEWFLRQPNGSLSVIQFGGPDDLPVPADYLGAGQPQIAVLRPVTHEWFIHQLDGGVMRVQWGGPNDIPVPADYVGTGRAQVAVLRPSTHEWFIRRDDGSLLHFQFGGPEDVPVPADYFGVGRAQIAVYRPSTSEWFILTPQGGAARTQWGGWLDRPVPGDYLGERKAQIAIYRPSTSEFFIRKGNGQLEHVQFGMRGDEPVPYDYGDSGKLQIGIYRPGMGEWFVQQESGGAAKVPWGGWGDVPVPGAFSPH